jgi:hypothetical protein
MTTMVRLSAVMILGAVGLGVVAGGIAARPIGKMIEAESAAGLANRGCQRGVSARR